MHKKTFYKKIKKNHLLKYNLKFSIDIGCIDKGTFTIEIIYIRVCVYER